MSKLEIGEYLKKILAEIAFELDMVKLKPKDPFRLTSGKPSPVYVDARLWTQSSLIANLFVDAMKWKIEDEDIEFDLVAGGVTAGVPYSERLAGSLDEPSIYIRDKAKGYGKSAQIEGSEDLEGKKVLLIEDLITTGGSKLDFIEGVERAGGTVEDCLVVFNRKQGGEKTLKKKDVELHSVITLPELVEYGLEKDKISEEEAESLMDYIRDPEAWEEKFLKKNPGWEESE